MMKTNEILGMFGQTVRSVVYLNSFFNGGAGSIVKFFLFRLLRRTPPRLIPFELYVVSSFKLQLQAAGKKCASLMWGNNNHNKFAYSSSCASVL